LSRRVVGVRCVGERLVTFAILDGESVHTGQRVIVSVNDEIRPGVVIIAPDQLLEFRAPEPRAHAEIDRTPAEPVSGEAAELLRSLELPE
jgi:hypothetical protein